MAGLFSLLLALRLIKVLFSFRRAAWRLYPLSPPPLCLPLPTPCQSNHPHSQCVYLALCADHLPGSCCGNCRCRLQLISNSINKATCLPSSLPSALFICKPIGLITMNGVGEFSSVQFGSVRYSSIRFWGSCICCLSIEAHWKPISMA